MNCLVAKNEIVKIRRAPKFLPFILTGSALGLIIALIVGFSLPASSDSRSQIQGILIAYFTGGGLGLGIIAALVLDRIFSARIKSAEATKLEG